MSLYTQINYYIDKIPYKYRNVISYTNGGYYVDGQRIAMPSADSDEIEEAYQQYLVQTAIDNLQRKIRSKYRSSSSQLTSAKKLYRQKIKNLNLTMQDYLQKLDRIAPSLNSLEQIKSQIAKQISGGMKEEIISKQSIENSIDNEITKLEKIYSNFSKEKTPSLKKLEDIRSEINGISTNFFNCKESQNIDFQPIIDAFNSLCSIVSEALSTSNQLFDETDKQKLQQKIEAVLKMCPTNLNGINDAAKEIQTHYSEIVKIAEQRLKRKERDISREEYYQLEKQLFQNLNHVGKIRERIYGTVGMQDYSGSADALKKDVKKLLDSFNFSDLNEEYIDEYKDIVEYFSSRFDSAKFWNQLEYNDLIKLRNRLMLLKDNNSVLSGRKKSFESRIRQIKRFATIAGKEFDVPKMSLLNFEQQEKSLEKILADMKTAAVLKTYQETIKQISRYFQEKNFIELKTERTSRMFEGGLSSHQRVFVDEKNPFILRVVTIYSNSEVISETRPAVLEHNGKFYYLPLSQELLKQLNNSCDRAKDNKLIDYKGGVEEDHKTLEDVFYYRVSDSGTQLILDLYKSNQDMLNIIKQRETDTLNEKINNITTSLSKKEMSLKIASPKGGSQS